MSVLLKKCIDELGKDKPRIDYVLGILETLCDMGDNKPAPSSLPVGTYVPTPPSTVNTSMVFPSGIVPLVPPPVDPALIEKLRGGATIEDFPVPLN